MNTTDPIADMLTRIRNANNSKHKTVDIPASNMKKAIAITSLILTFFIIYFLQTNIFTWFTIGGIMPNLFIILVLFIGLFVGKKLGFVLGIVFGLIIDFLLGQAVGVSAFLLGIIGLIAEYLDKSFSKDSRIMLMMIVIAGTVFFEVGYYVFKIIKYGAAFEFVPFIKILVIEIIFNIFLTIIIYPLIQNMGNKLEEIFKNKKVLSRYY